MELLARGMSVMVLTNNENSFIEGQFSNFFTTYNRTALQRIVFDLAAICSDANSIEWQKHSPFRVVLFGIGRGGLPALVAAPAADAVIADCDQLDTSSDENLLAADLFCPGIRNIGTFEGPAMLGAPHPLLLHDTGSHFATEGIKSAYKAASESNKLRIESKRLSDEELINWISRLN
jgi:hypothetical protein